MQILNKILKYKKILSFLLGSISVFALPPNYIIISMFIGFSGLLYLLNNAKSKKNAFALGYFFGFGFFAFGLSWIVNALMLDLPRLGWLIPLTLIGSGGFFGLFVAFPALLTFYGKNIAQKICIFSSLWVIFEWIRSFIFSGFPWNLLGYSLAFNPANIQFAAVAGTYGLSLILLVSTCLPALFLVNQTKKSALTALGIIILLMGGNYAIGSWRLSKLDNKDLSDIKVRLVQPSIPQQLKWDRESLEANLDSYISYSQKPEKNDVDLVIWGETANTFALDFEPQYLEKLKKAVPQNGYLITGSISYAYSDEQWRPQNSMLAIDKSDIIASYHKSHLVPFGEYIPLRKYLPSSLKPVTNFISDFLAGNGNQTIKLPNIPPFGVLICYEVIFPAQITDKQNRPQWIINLTNDGWYGIGSGPYQHLVTSQLRAVEEGLTIVRAANSGISAIISRTGIIIDRIPLHQEAILDINLPQELSIKTIYSQYQNAIPALLCLVLLMLGIFPIKRK